MKNKVILITGGNTGIGLATAKRFLIEGANVVINYIANEENISNILTALKENSQGDVIAVKADITIDEERKFLIKATLQKFKKIDVLVNNAGLTNFEFDFPDISLKGFKETIAVNLEAPIFLSKLFADKLIDKKQSGCIINIASVAGYRGNENIHYGSSKAALINATKTMARKLAKYNIRVNSISPGFVLTEMSVEWKKNNLETWNRILKEIPMGRAASSETVANAIFFLSSDDSNMTTGIDLPIDGGFLS